MWWWENKAGWSWGGRRRGMWCLVLSFYFLWIYIMYNLGFETVLNFNFFPHRLSLVSLHLDFLRNFSEFSIHIICVKEIWLSLLLAFLLYIFWYFHFKLPLSLFIVLALMLSRAQPNQCRKMCMYEWNEALAKKNENNEVGKVKMMM